MVGIHADVVGINLKCGRHPPTSSGASITTLLQAQLAQAGVDPDGCVLPIFR